MPVLISQNLVESCIFLNENHAHLRKNYNIRKSISAFYHQIFFSHLIVIVIARIGHSPWGFSGPILQCLLRLLGEIGRQLI